MSCDPIAEWARMTCRFGTPMRAPSPREGEKRGERETESDADAFDGGGIVGSGELAEELPPELGEAAAEDRQ